MRKNKEIEIKYLIDVLKNLIVIFNMEHRTDYEFHDYVYRELIEKLYYACEFNVPCSVEFKTEKRINGSTFIRVKTILDYNISFEVSAGPLDRSGFNDRRN